MPLPAGATVARITAVAATARLPPRPTAAGRVAGPEAIARPRPPLEPASARTRRPSRPGAISGVTLRGTAGARVAAGAGVATAAAGVVAALPGRIIAGGDALSERVAPLGATRPGTIRWLRSAGGPPPGRHGAASDGGPVGSTGLPARDI